MCEYTFSRPDSSWKRWEYYNFFSKFDEPFYGITVNLDCTAAYRKAKERNQSFFILYLHKAVKSANLVKEFRYRIDDQGPLLIDKINVSATIGRTDHTFGFSFIEFDPDFERFRDNALPEIKRIESLEGLTMDEKTERLDTIHCSALPWIPFTATSHARDYKTIDGIPKITFGRMFESGDKKLMPVSAHVHHGLVDGYHVGLYFEVFQGLMSE